MTRPAGVLAIWHDIDPVHEAEVLEWYNREHHPERVSIPGFLRARRYVARSGEPKYFITYEVESPRVLVSNSYIQRVNNPTLWTQKSMVHFLHNIRTACLIAHRDPGPSGAYVATLRLCPQPGAQQRLYKALVEEIFPELLRRHAMLLRSELWTAELEVTTPHSVERNLRRTPDDVIDWVVIIHASSQEGLDEALNTSLTSQRLYGVGAESEVTPGCYQLQYTLDTAELLTHS